MTMAHAIEVSSRRRPKRPMSDEQLLAHGYPPEFVEACRLGDERGHHSDLSVVVKERESPLE
jgi:hypothetical protein